MSSIVSMKINNLSVRKFRCPDCKTVLVKTKGRVIEYQSNGLGREEEIVFWKCKCKISK